MKWLLAILIILLLVLQWRLWFGDFSLPAAWRLTEQINAQNEENAELDKRNTRLEAEVKDLKQGLSAIEERARSELGMIKDDEVFYQVVDLPPDNKNPAEMRPENGLDKQNTDKPGSEKANDEDPDHDE